ncbi:DUF2199 domain-containing protein [Microbacterium trichothecenolyticum]|uniref:DUF2199 domain-containing protein n=1 Tax=Microbacterium trichothecenolyticum TaxID=69370 RepID=UPI001C6EDD02|nr:DUF2199 domain-containing protein [Microbacterium trichothecenolyticum]MBW9119067.1 DUF2199 domain-containing protein [Microbacterium trichothecenolyticum]
MTIDTCAHCGVAVDLHDRDIRFTQPEPVLDAPDIEPSDVWMTGKDADESVLMQVQGVGTFVRALLRVQLSGGSAVTYGVWVGIDPTDLPRVMDVWWKPEYADLQLEGVLANFVEPWGLYGSRVSLRVLNEDHTPYCVASPESTLAAVINDEWDHKFVLDTLR